jgi:hypothetical protein
MQSKAEQSRTEQKTADLGRAEIKIESGRKRQERQRQRQRQNHYTIESLHYNILDLLTRREVEIDLEEIGGRY